MPVARALVPLLAIALGATLAGCAEGGVVRVVDGRRELGRFISDDAYELFAAAATAEAQGDLAAARKGFRAAADEDPASPEIWTRLGALDCREGGIAAAKPRFDRALALDPRHAPAYRERARCLLAGGDAAAALPDAERAFTLDPDHTGTALVRAEALEATGHLDEARRALEAAAIRRPAEALPAEARLAFARRHGDASVAPGPFADIDVALRRGDLASARRRARALHLPSAEVALRAAALGLAKTARAEAELILGADPRDTSARIALASAADLAGDLATLEKTLAGPRPSAPPSALGRLLFAEVLLRRSGPEAARAWLVASRSEVAPAPAGADALLIATEARVRALGLQN